MWCVAVVVSTLSLNPVTGARAAFALSPRLHTTPCAVAMRIPVTNATSATLSAGQLGYQALLAKYGEDGVRELAQQGHAAAADSVGGVDVLARMGHAAAAFSVGSAAELGRLGRDALVDKYGEVCPFPKHSKTGPSRSVHDALPSTHCAGRGARLQSAGPRHGCGQRRRS